MRSALGGARAKASKRAARSAHAERTSRSRCGRRAPTTIAHGFASVSRFFPGARDVLAAIDDEVASVVLGPPAEGKAACFEDQYISTGGQLYELMMGHDRYIADLRPLVGRRDARRGLPSAGLCCHPYDLCTTSSPRSGRHRTDPHGNRRSAPLDVVSDVAWIGYANATLAAQVEPALRDAAHPASVCSD